MENMTPNTFTVKKFYFLDYFYILLLSVKMEESYDRILDRFIALKKEYSLGESKYKKISIDRIAVSRNQLVTFEYTFNQVVSEALTYGLIKKTSESHDVLRKPSLLITKLGIEALNLYSTSKKEFNLFIFQKMESKNLAFYNLLKLCYNDNSSKNGLLVFPIYSGLKLGFEKSTFTTVKQVYEYSKTLRERLEKDLERYDKSKSINLADKESELLRKLCDDGFISENKDAPFDAKSKYNALLSRFRKFWLSYILQSIYNYEYSFDTFNIWVERAKQLGILHTTEFFPDFNNFSGRIVYPTSVITPHTNNNDFREIYRYQNNDALYLYEPIWNTFQDSFIKQLHAEYYNISQIRKTHFINLLDLKERVCFKLRIASSIFDDFLERTYMLNLNGSLNKMQISLEADKLPQETNAMYLRREPVMINGKYKNIIAINYK